ncbi:phosphonate transport system substrate-binding protein [Lentzea xinjiangensis]|uniref:Phosphonate transport system substrate-binding protein n=1 Tax=Lentzea xinjiangensis TaxID=402600 RepID=A0A1H9GJV9_9PSEU|nr:phosphate/phosphite/phosphonate ABC transporter substrate-binding protein [Lentzea xinjiangensis]SEQ50340.1 phosphonate transport system substrate-binding protein [Lentzea xinjiangensis]
MNRLLLAVLLLASCSAAPPDEAPERQVLVFSGTPTASSITTQQMFLPIINMLRRETGVEIRVQESTTYDALIDGMRDGSIDIGAFGPQSYVVARERGARITPVSAQVKEQGATPSYRGYGIVRAGSPVGSLADLRGHRVCYADRVSTSGFLFPSAALREAGLDPVRDTVPVFTSGHEAAVLAVVNEQCEAGFAFDEMVDRHLVERGQIQPGRLKKIWTSELIPGAPLAVADDLPEPLRQRIVAALQTKATADHLRANGFCQGECPVGDATAWGYAKVDDSVYEPVRAACRKVGWDSCTPGA